MKIISTSQNDIDWQAAKLGIPSASNFDRIVTAGGKRSTQAKEFMNQLLAEMITRDSEEIFTGNKWTNRGKEFEEEAAQFYALQTDLEVVRVGFCTNDDGTFGASPDRLVGAEGLLEVKCVAGKNQVDTILTELDQKLADDYKPQLQGQLYVTGCKWVDIISYHPKITPVITRVERDEAFLTTLSGALEWFHQELMKKRLRLIELGHLKEAA